VPGIDAVAPVLRAFPEWTTEARFERSVWPVAGVDDRFFARGAPRLSKRLPEFADDESVFRATVTDPSLAIVPDFILQQGGGPPEEVVQPGDELRMYNPVTGREHVVRVAAIPADDWVFNGPIMSRDFVREFMSPAVFENRHYLSVEVGKDPDDLTASLDAELVANGSNARSFRAEVSKQLEQQRAFFSLMNGYLGLGLAIGIAGLGVVMVRAVRERRRQIGMLRAMGFSARVVRGSFLLEAAFIALQGSLLGIGLGLVCAYQVLVNTDVFGTSIAFGVPWRSLSVIFAIPFVVSLLAAAAPATQASRIRPAAALRIAA
jgi:putative ABC transport system permease protein